MPAKLISSFLIATFFLLNHNIKSYGNPMHKDAYVQAEFRLENNSINSIKPLNLNEFFFFVDLVYPNALVNGSIISSFELDINEIKSLLEAKPIHKVFFVEIKKKNTSNTFFSIDTSNLDLELQIRIVKKYIRQIIMLDTCNIGFSETSFLLHDLSNNFSINLSADNWKQTIESIDDLVHSKKDIVFDYLLKDEVYSKSTGFEESKLVYLGYTNLSFKNLKINDSVILIMRTTIISFFPNPPTDFEMKSVVLLPNLYNQTDGLQFVYELEKREFSDLQMYAWGTLAKTEKKYNEEELYIQSNIIFKSCNFLELLYYRNNLFLKCKLVDTKKNRILLEGSVLIYPLDTKFPELKLHEVTEKPWIPYPYAYCSYENEHWKRTVQVTRNGIKK